MEVIDRGNEEAQMNKATTTRKDMMARLTTLVTGDGRIFTHDPATVGHAKHTAACWIPLVKETK